MALSPEDKTELQAMILATVGGLVQALQQHLDQQILELQADVETALEKLDSIELDVKDTRLQLAKVSREQIKDRRRDEAVAKRLDETDRRLTSLEKRDV